MKKNVLFVLLFLTLSVCACTTTREAIRHVNHVYVGRSLDAFILAHGMPYTQFELTNGEMVYLWSSGIVGVPQPAITTVYVTGPPMFRTAWAQTSGGGTINVFCEVQIHTSRDGTILDILLLRGTIGLWTVSRCAECFK